MYCTKDARSLCDKVRRAFARRHSHRARAFSAREERARDCCSVRGKEKIRRAVAIFHDDAFIGQPVGRVGTRGFTFARVLVEMTNSRRAQNGSAELSLA